MEALSPRRFTPTGVAALRPLLAARAVPEELIRGIEAAARVLPFRVNDYVLDELIRWEDVPDDPFFQLAFPQPGMLLDDELPVIRRLLDEGAPPAQLADAVRRFQLRRNPHPAGQLDHNIPTLAGRPLAGMQHKYAETVLFFPAPGQSCHAWCTYCFRWPQFSRLTELKFSSTSTDDLVAYLRAHPEVSDVLFTGGDPMVMRASVLRRYVEPLLAPALAHVQNIRIGTRSLSWWPHRFTTDPDADDVLRLFEDVVKTGRTLAVMAHYAHPRELEPAVARRALARVRATGAVVRTQAPLVRHVNDDPALWSKKWRREVRLGAVPYYLFVERDTGARHYFELPLVRAQEIFAEAWRHVSGLARTARGPSMSATPGKVRVVGTAEVSGQRAFVLEFLQARDARWVGRPFFARFDPQATWFDQLVPLLPAERFFFEEEEARAEAA